MKTSAIVLSVFLALLGCAAGPAWAAQNCASPTQKGSLLIFPKIDVRMMTYGETCAQRDTIVRISNDSGTPVTVSCFWVNSELDKTGFTFILPGNVSGWFRASDGLASFRLYNEVASFPVPFQINPITKRFYPSTGELKCFAVDADSGIPISFNHLFGSAEVVEGESGFIIYGYPSWNFTARNVPLGYPVGQPGVLPLSGNNGDYDACPSYLTTEFQPTGLGGPGTEITLIPCKEDFRQDGGFLVTKALFDIFDMNGNKVGNAWKCVNTFFDDYLQNISPAVDPWTGFLVGAYGGPNFNLLGCGQDNGRLRVSAVASTVCESPYYFNFWRDMVPSGTAPSGIPGSASAYYTALGMGPTGSSTNTSFLGVVVKHGSHGGLFSKLPAGAGIDPTGKIIYDPFVGPITPESLK